MPTATARGRTDQHQEGAQKRLGFNDRARRARQEEPEVEGKKQHLRDEQQRRGRERQLRVPACQVCEDDDVVDAWREQDEEHTEEECGLVSGKEARQDPDQHRDEQKIRTVRAPNNRCCRTAAPSSRKGTMPGTVCSRQILVSLVEENGQTSMPAEAKSFTGSLKVEPDEEVQVTKTNCPWGAVARASRRNTFAWRVGCVCFNWYACRAKPSFVG